MGTIEKELSERNGYASVVMCEPDDWRERAVLAALRAETYYGEGESELLRQIRIARPDAATLVINVDREQLVKFLDRRAAPCREMVPTTKRWGEANDRLYCAAWFEGIWEGRAIEIAFTPATYEKGIEICIGPDIESLKRLAKDLDEEAIRPVGRCLRFTSHWEHARDLDAELGKVTWDDVILQPETAAQIRESVTSFFAHRDIYRMLGFAWKRGLLLVGPPGTGKTMICKAIAASRPDAPFLYVRDVREDGRRSSDAVRDIFDRARRLAPCILAFEDIDGLVNQGTRTVFLNELDGFKNNDGLFVVASSNYPAKIDEALLKRPSRFDRVFHIGLPDLAERREFCLRILRRVKTGMNSSDDLDIGAIASRVASLTDGFTPAYLKEALISAALARAHKGVSTLDEGYADEVVRQVGQLGEYIRRSKNPDAWTDMRSPRDSVGFRS